GPVKTTFISRRTAGKLQSKNRNARRAAGLLPDMDDVRHMAHRRRSWLGKTKQGSARAIDRTAVVEPRKTQCGSDRAHIVRAPSRRANHRRTLRLPRLADARRFRAHESCARRRVSTEPSGRCARKVEDALRTYPKRRSSCNS